MSYIPLNLVIAAEQALNNNDVHRATILLSVLEGYLQAQADVKMALERVTPPRQEAEPAATQLKPIEQAVPTAP